MRSLIILEVEHGETTDQIQILVDHIRRCPELFDDLRDIRLRNYGVRVDLPACFVLDSGGRGTCSAHADIHAFTDECVGWRDA